MRTPQFLSPDARVWTPIEMTLSPDARAWSPIKMTLSPDARAWSPIKMTLSPDARAWSPIEMSSTLFADVKLLEPTETSTNDVPHFSWKHIISLEKERSKKYIHKRCEIYRMFAYSKGLVNFRYSKVFGSGPAGIMLIAPVSDLRKLVIKLQIRKKFSPGEDTFPQILSFGETLESERERIQKEMKISDLRFGYTLNSDVLKWLKQSPFYVPTNGLLVCTELITRKARMHGHNNHNINLPGGSTISSETRIETAIRELKEETGLTIPTFSSKGCCSVRVSRTVFFVQAYTSSISLKIDDKNVSIV
jgi:hypothetical protein